MSKYIAPVSAALVGWNVGILAAFLIAIVIGASFSGMGVPLKGAFAVIATGIAAISLGIFLGVVAYSRVRRWFGGLGQMQGYIWLIVLVLVTTAIFPAPFGFNIE